MGNSLFSRSAGSWPAPLPSAPGDQSSLNCWPRPSAGVWRGSLSEGRSIHSFSVTPTSAKPYKSLTCATTLDGGISHHDVWGGGGSLLNQSLLFPSTIHENFKVPCSELEKENTESWRYWALGTRPGKNQAGHAPQPRGEGGGAGAPEVVSLIPVPTIWAIWKVLLQGPQHRNLAEA